MIGGGKNQIKLLSLNVCGLISKLKFPEFINLIRRYDIIGIQESKTDDTDSVNIPDYTVFYHNRTNISRFRSGGITLIIKNEILPYVKIDQVRNSKVVLLFTISRQLFHSTEDINCGIIYVPPYGSRYAVDDPFLEIQSELLRYCVDSKHILLFGDFNSRTGTLSDNLKFDENICEVNNLNDLFNENNEILGKLDLYNVPLNRFNADNTVNTYGRQLLELCKNNNLFILNGRIGQDRVVPRTTCKDKSTVDYFLSSAYNFAFICEFSVLEFSDVLSDAHCPLSLVLSADCQVNVKEKAERIQRWSDAKVKKWDSQKSDNYLENFDLFRVAEIEIKIEEMINNGNVSSHALNEIVANIGTLFKTCSKETFGEQKSSYQNNTDKIKPWFNAECSRARNLYHKCRKMYNKYKTEYYKNVFKSVSKKYKRILTVSNRKYKDNKIKQIRTLKTTDPRKYWKIINPQSKTDKNMAPLDDLYNFFKASNTTDSSDTDNNMNYEEVENDELNEEINTSISENEILQAVKNLKNNKSSGVDDIVNEQIKTTISYMLPIYHKLFNVIFDTGIIPEYWTMGNIKPIYKSKGDPKQPENYRPITILSCFGKLFTAIINNRLNQYADNHNIISSSQSGFRKRHSTVDNLFIIKSLIDLVRSSRKKLYCCFVDFKQAFDTVWRDGLWTKLLQSRINGKCFNIIHNLYKDIKSKVTTSEGTSNYFSSNIGVRQGENLSPFLFSVFLNDLESYLRNKEISGITCDINNDELRSYLQIFILLYADDTVIFSDNESDMQHALDAFEEYCLKWKLTVNTEKTKIVIFGQGRRKSNLNFMFNRKEIEVLKEYKYLGVLLGQSGSFQISKKYIAEQGNKAMFSLLRKIKNLSLPFDIQIDLFNKIVKPVLLYGCEVWGFGNLDILERVQLKFYKYIFNLKSSTPSNMIYGETGVMPLTFDIQCRIISFWSKLIDTEQSPGNKLSSLVYRILYTLYNYNRLRSQWVDCLKTLICSLGFSGFWHSQSVPNMKWFVKASAQKIRDVFIQKWFSIIGISSTSNIYRIFKTKFEQSSYLSILSSYYCKRFLAFRTRNHRLPVEVGRWRGIPLQERYCAYCSNVIGDEFHFLLVCQHFQQHRSKYLQRYYYKNPNIIKFEELMNIVAPKKLKKLCMFIDIIMKTVSSV